MPTVSSKSTTTAGSRTFRASTPWDVTAYPVKQGGLATQQADVVAETIASEAGVPVQATPLDPVLRADPGVVDWEPLWWPPAKVAGLYLAPFLAENLELAGSGQP